MAMNYFSGQSFIYNGFQVIKILCPEGQTDTDGFECLIWSFISQLEHGE